MTRLSEELNSWFALCARPDDRGRLREPSTADVAAAISADSSHDVSVSRSYLAALRSGSQANPTIAMVEALVAYFRPRLQALDRTATVGQLIGEQSGPQVEHDDEWARLLADRQVQSIAMRAGTMTPAMRRQVLRMMEVLDPQETGEVAGEP